MSDEKFKRELESIKGDRKLLADVWGDAVESYMRITNGREVVDMSPEEYLSDLFEKQRN